LGGFCSLEASTLGDRSVGEGYRVTAKL